jgi:putative transcriptional regulator
MNKPLEYTISDLVPDVEASFKIYNGGPVEQDNLYFIHTLPELIYDSIEISHGIYWGGDFDRTKSLINEGKINKEDIRFFLGYTGWGANQLEEEIESNSWAIAANKQKKALLSTSSKKIWKEKITELGGDYLIWPNAPENPNLN